jgi:hypothetical protein
MGKQKIFTQAIVVVMILMLVVGTAAEAFAFGIRTIRHGVRGVNVQQLGDFLTRHGYSADPAGPIFGSLAGGTLFSFNAPVTCWPMILSGSRLTVLLRFLKVMKSSRWKTS